MTGKYIRLRDIEFCGRDGKSASLTFKNGVNVICGASDTGKSFLVEALDFMLGGKKLRYIPQSRPYQKAKLRFNLGTDERYTISRNLEGGEFELEPFDEQQNPSTLSDEHEHGNTKTLSGFLLDKIELHGRKVLKSKSERKTQSLSFRNLARLVIVQEGDIHDSKSPFLTKNNVTNTSEFATVKLLLTGKDDSSVKTPESNPKEKKLKAAFIDEMIKDITSQLGTPSSPKDELPDQEQKLAVVVEEKQQMIASLKEELSHKINERDSYYHKMMQYENRKTEIAGLLTRFDLLRIHYEKDQERLAAVEESGSMFVHLPEGICPLCGAEPSAEQRVSQCDADGAYIVTAARAEIAKIAQLKRELKQTIQDLRTEDDALTVKLNETKAQFDKSDADIREKLSPSFAEAFSSFTSIIEKHAKIKSEIQLSDWLEKWQNQRKALNAKTKTDKPSTEIPLRTAEAFCNILSHILKAWHFPGECQVHYDKDKKDFVIDGKPRGSRGKGLRAITHAAVTLALMEYCRKNSLPHPGFVVMDSPLLAYYKPEGDDDRELQGTDLKERFYEYLVQEYGNDSQVIIIENEHPQIEFLEQLNMIVFTGNDKEGRVGLL